MNRYEMNSLRRAACAAARDEVRKMFRQDVHYQCASASDAMRLGRALHCKVETRILGGCFKEFSVDRPKPKDFDVMLQGSDSFTFYRGEWRRDSEMLEFKRQAQQRLQEAESKVSEAKEHLARFRVT